MAIIGRGSELPQRVSALLFQLGCWSYPPRRSSMKTLRADDGGASRRRSLRLAATPLRSTTATQAVPSPREPDGCPSYRILRSCSSPTAAAIRCHRLHKPPEHTHERSTETQGRTARRLAPLAALRGYRADGRKFDVQHEQASCFSLTSSTVGNRRRPHPEFKVHARAPASCL